MFHLKNTKLACVTFNGSFKDVDIEDANFTGSKGAVINLKKVKDSNLSFTNLCDVLVIGSTDNIILDYTSFKGAKRLNERMIKINPKTINKRIMIDGNFDGCKIKYANFTGSLNTVINPQKIYTKNLTGVNFTDAIVVDNFKGFLLTSDMFMCQSENLIDETKTEESDKEYVIRKIKSLFK